MPSYSSKSQKRSQSQSKNGGRRRKRTLKNVRRRKSRKVMMGGGKYSNEQLAEAYKKYMTKPGGGIFLARQWVYPTLFTLTTVGMNTEKERDGIPLFWKYPDALEKALKQDPQLNEKINNNEDLISNLSPKTPDDKGAAAATLGYITEKPKQLSPEEEQDRRLTNTYFV